MSNNFDFIAYKGKKKLPYMVDVPALEGVPLIETHAHLDMLEDPTLALARAAHVGITSVLTLSLLGEGRDATTYELLDVWREGAQNLLDEHAAQTGTPAPKVPDTYIIIGMHPHDSRHFTDATEKLIRQRAKDSRTVGIGEAGLDYYYDHSPREVQRAIYARHLELAHELDLPIVIHLRDAHDDGLQILRDVGVPKAGAVLHCYNREPNVAEPFLELGCILGFGGPVTFKNAHEVKEAVIGAPSGRIIVETDCPFMAPTPFRGQKCEPAHTLWVAAEVAQLRGMTLQDFASESSKTAQRIFKLP